MDAAKRQYALDQWSIPRLLFALLRHRFTGVASLGQVLPEPGPRQIWFRGGMPIYTDWVSPPDVLGEVLLHRGLVSPTAFEQGLAGMARDGGLLGQVLLGAGALDQRTLSDALRSQCRRKLAHVFALREGIVEVESVEHGKGNGDELSGQVNVLRLIVQGVSNHFDEARIRTEMGPAFAGKIGTTPAFSKYKSQFGFRREDDVVLRELARGRRFDEIVVPGLNRGRVAQIVYVLWACQMLLSGDDVKTAAGKSAPPAKAAPTTPSPAATASPAAPQPPADGAPETKAPAKPSPKPPPKTPVRAAPPTSAPAAKASPPAAASAPGKTRSPEPKPKRKLDRTTLADPTVEPTKIPDRMRRARADRMSEASDTEFENELASIETRIGENAHPFALFEIPLDSDRKQIRARWAQLSGRFHPDRLESEGLGHLRERVERVFAALSEANGILGNKEERATLKAAIESGTDPAKPGQDARTIVRNAMEAEMLARDADKLLKRGSFARALELYEQALALHSAEAEIQAAAAWARYQVAERTRDAAAESLAVLANAIEEQPKCARAHYYIGLIKLQTQDEPGAIAAFRDTLLSDRHFTDAERQLRAINLKKKAAETKATEAASSSKKSGLRGLFSRKD